MIKSANTIINAKKQDKKIIEKLIPVFTHYLYQQLKKHITISNEEQIGYERAIRDLQKLKLCTKT